MYISEIYNDDKNKEYRGETRVAVYTLYGIMYRFCMANNIDLNSMECNININDEDKGFILFRID